MLALEDFMIALRASDPNEDLTLVLSPDEVRALIEELDYLRDRAWRNEDQ